MKKIDTYSAQYKIVSEHQNHPDHENMSANQNHPYSIMKFKVQKIGKN